MAHADPIKRRRYLDRKAAAIKVKRDKHPDFYRNAQFQRKYGIDIDQWNKMHADQRGLCAICRNPPAAGKRLVVDHCHKTGHVRSLLCVACNVGIGMFQDDPDRLHAAGLYLTQFNEY